MLSDAHYTVTPCDIARNTETIGRFGMSADKSDCADLVQFVSTKNPEYFGEFKRISAT